MAYRAGLCVKHGGSYLCEYEGCDKKIGGRGFCVVHGGKDKKRRGTKDKQCEVVPPEDRRMDSIIVPLPVPELTPAAEPNTVIPGPDEDASVQEV